MPSARLAQLNAEIRRCEVQLLQAVEVVGKDDLKDRLRGVLSVVQDMHGKRDAWFFPFVKSKLERAVGKIIELNVENDVDWEKFRALLEQCATVFSAYIFIPIRSIGETFKALHEGLNPGLMDKREWSAIIKGKRDEKVIEIMRSLGAAIKNKIKRSNIEAILGDSGFNQMQDIARLLADP